MACKVNHLTRLWLVQLERVTGFVEDFDSKIHKRIPDSNFAPKILKLALIYSSSLGVLEASLCD